MGACHFPRGESVAYAHSCFSAHGFGLGCPDRPLGYAGKPGQFNGISGGAGFLPAISAASRVPASRGARLRLPVTRASGSRSPLTTPPPPLTLPKIAAIQSHLLQDTNDITPGQPLSRSRARLSRGKPQTVAGPKMWYGSRDRKISR